MSDYRNPGGVLAIIGNPTSSNYAPPGPSGIDNRVFTGMSATMRPPGQRFPTMPLLERITPRSLPAGRTLTTQAARANVAFRLTTRRAWQTMAGYVNAAKMRR